MDFFPQPRGAATKKLAEIHRGNSFMRGRPRAAMHFRFCAIPSPKLVSECSIHPFIPDPTLVESCQSSPHRSLSLHYIKNRPAMTVNTAPLKWAQRSDSLYVTIALPGECAIGSFPLHPVPGLV